MRTVLLLSTLLLSTPWVNEGAAGDAFGLIDQLQTNCENQAMSLASRLSDTFASYDEATDTATRMLDPYLLNNLDSKNSKATGTHVMANKWVYLYGDLTLRPLFTTLLHQTTSPQNVQEQIAQSCLDQPHRTPQTISTHTDTGSMHMTHEGTNRSIGEHHVSHHANHLKGKTCHFGGFGTIGKLTYDWKHTPYDEYDKWLFSTGGPWTNTGPQSPDLLVLQVGRSTCAHSMDSRKASTEMHLDETARGVHVKQIEGLMDAVKEAMKRAGRSKHSVLVVTAPRVVVGNYAADSCMWEVNRRIARAAHRRGFAVLEREEIEHRLGYRMEHSVDLFGREGFTPVEPPSAGVVTTTLVSMLQCLGNATASLVPMATASA